MNEQKTKVDVLAVMDSCITNVECEDCMPPANPEQVAVMFRAARAAVAELIEASRRAERLLREMADAGFGDPTQADDLRSALTNVGNASH